MKSLTIDNRIVNGSFESGSLAPFLSLNVVIDSSRSHSGFFSARMAGDTANAILYQVVPVSAGENFELFVSLAKVGTAPSPPMTIFVSYYSTSFTFLGNGLLTSIPANHLPNEVSGTDWTEIYQTTEPVPDLATQAYVFIGKLPQAGSADVLVDDVSLLAIPIAEGGINSIYGDGSAGELHVGLGQTLKLETTPPTGANLQFSSVLVEGDLIVPSGLVLQSSGNITVAGTGTLSILPGAKDSGNGSPHLGVSLAEAGPSNGGIGLRLLQAAKVTLPNAAAGGVGSRVLLGNGGDGEGGGGGGSGGIIHLISSTPPTVTGTLQVTGGSPGANAPGTTGNIAVGGGGGACGGLNYCIALEGIFPSRD